MKKLVSTGDFYFFDLDGWNVILLKQIATSCSRNAQPSIRQSASKAPLP
jgi:hypothetical protein